MDLETEEGMVWEPEHAYSAKSVHYLAVDTNVFISHLNMIRAIHALLAEIRPSPPLILLVPSIVIHELDGLTRSRVQEAADSPATLGMTARAGNKWLLEANRNRRATGYGALRCQALNEKWDPAVKESGKGDDQVLDCCLYFAHHGARVSLWTEDQNLSVKAESNDIPTFGDRQMTLHRFFSITGPGEEYPGTLWDQVRRLEGDLFQSHLHDQRLLSIDGMDGKTNGHRQGHGHGHGNGHRVDLDMDMDMDMDVEMYGGMELDIDLSRNNRSGGPVNGSTPYHPIQDLINDPSYISALALPSPPQEIERRRYPYLLPARTDSDHEDQAQDQDQDQAPIAVPPTASNDHAGSRSISGPSSTSILLPVRAPSPPSTYLYPRALMSTSISGETPILTPQPTSSVTTSLPSTKPTPTTPIPTRPTTPATPFRQTPPATSTTSRSTTPFTNLTATTNMTPLRTSPRKRTDNSGPSKILLTSLQLALRPCTLSLIAHCPPTPASDTATSAPTPIPTPPTSTPDILPALISTLTYLDSTCSAAGEPTNSDTRMALLRGISSAKTIKNYVEYHAPTVSRNGSSYDLDIRSIIARENGNGRGTGTRRIRSGEVIDALRELIRACTHLGVDKGDEGVIEDVIDDLRRLG
ncbi:hypothetical protein IAU59_006474 [Kwoniella sp. CBS 9459]